MMPQRPGDHMKTDRRDAMTLARLLRAGELTAIWGPDEAHEAVCDLIRARHSAQEDATGAKQTVRSFMLRHDRRFGGNAAWTKRWMHGVFIALDNPARAQSFIAEIAATMTTIAERLSSFPARNELATGLRSARHGRYLIFFVASDVGVQIVRVLHGARDLPQAFATH